MTEKMQVTQKYWLLRQRCFTSLNMTRLCKAVNAENLYCAQIDNLIAVLERRSLFFSVVPGCFCEESQFCFFYGFAVRAENLSSQASSNDTRWPSSTQNSLPNSYYKSVGFWVYKHSIVQNKTSNAFQQKLFLHERQNLAKGQLKTL